MNKRNKNKVDATGYDSVMLCIVTVTLLCLVSPLTTENSEQHDTIDTLSSESAKYETILGYIDIHDCACGGHAELVLDEPLGEYYIQCEECGLRTSYYGKDECQALIEYWENLFE